MGLWEKLSGLLQDDYEPTVERYDEAWGKHCPKMDIEHLEELSGKVVPVIEKSELLKADTHKIYFPCKMRIEENDVYTFYLDRDFSILSDSDHASNCFSAILRYPFKTGNIILRDQKSKGLNDKGQGLNFEHRGFSEDTWVTAEPEVLAYQFFHPRMIEHFSRFHEVQFHAMPGYLIMVQYAPWEYLSADMWREPNYNFKRLKAFHNVTKKFFPGVLELAPDSLKDDQTTATNK